MLPHGTTPAARGDVTSFPSIAGYIRVSTLSLLLPSSGKLMTDDCREMPTVCAAVLWSAFAEAAKR